jgi:BirA family biotin operon repressor/biotin-[acetyl-CoA-carboxylase] ligase
MQNKILHLLKKNDGYISGEELSHALKISRAGIWKYMQELREHGYEIVAVPHLGYKLLSSPDKLFPEEIQFDLKTKILGKRISYHETVPSTMDVAFQWGMDGTPEGTLVIAESQTKGRGRMGRGWSSPKGKGVYLSIILRPPLPPTQVAQLTLLSAVAVAEAIEDKTGMLPQIKWPNDLLLHHKKVAGILTELSAETDRVRFVVIGIGINVNTPLNSLPPHATSLKQEAKRHFSRVALTQDVLRKMEFWYGRLLGEGFSSILQRWKELSLTLRRPIRISDASGHLEGEAIDIDTDGGLLIRCDTGVIVKRMAGDVVFAH